MKHNKVILLILIIVILLFGTVLRFYQLDKIPGSLEWDEVSIGYNAYSILQTGKDEYGDFMPSAFRAFGEYKQPVYIYLDVVPIALFGLNDFSVRFPSALFGSLSIIFVYLLCIELFYKHKWKTKISVLSMLFFAISPWSIQFSRAAFEANVALCFIIAGTWLFLRGLRLKKRWYFFLSTFLLVLSSYTYISAKLFVPILFIGLIIYGRKYLLKQRVLSAILLILFIVLSFLWLLDTRSISRSQGVIFTVQQQQLLENSLTQMDYDTKQNDLAGTLMHNRRVVYGRTFIDNYLSHFNPQWLFFTGDDVNRHHAPDFGILYLISLPFILAGAYFYLSRIFNTTWLLFVWFLAAPLASALTFEAPHSLRSLIFLPTWHIFEAAGIIFLLSFLKKRILIRIGIVIIAVLYIVNFSMYLHQYFVHSNTSFQKDWQYGYKNAILYAQENKKENQRIIFAENYEQPYIFYLYYTKYNPQKYISEGGTARKKDKCFTIDNAYFGKCEDKLRKGDLYILLEDQSVFGAKEIRSFDYVNGQPATKVVEYNKL